MPAEKFTIKAKKRRPKPLSLDRRYDFIALYLHAHFRPRLKLHCQPAVMHRHPVDNPSDQLVVKLKLNKIAARWPAKAVAQFLYFF